MSDKEPQQWMRLDIDSFYERYPAIGTIPVALEKAIKRFAVEYALAATPLGVRHGTEPAESFRDWLIHGGAGHEDGEAGIRACTLPLSEAIEMVEQYLEYRAEVKSGKYPIARPSEALPDKCPRCGSKFANSFLWECWPEADNIPDSWHSSVATQKEDGK